MSSPPDRPRFRLSLRVAELWTLDTRSLALFRIGIAATLLLDLAIRSSSIGAHYADRGLWPRSRALSASDAAVDWSLHLATGSEAGIAALFGLAAACACAFALGYRTRLFGALSWVLLFSLQQRNPLVLNGGDALLRILLFWGLFLPLGARFSLDARSESSRRNTGEASCGVRARPSAGHRSAASLALVVQLALVYGSAALWKDHPVWRSEGSAVFYALHIDQLASPLGLWLREQPALLRPLTLGVWWLEAIGPALLLAPVRTAALRGAAVVLFLGLHLGLQLFLELGLFPLICAVAWLAMIPSGAWEARWTAGPRRSRSTPAAGTSPGPPAPGARSLQRAGAAGILCLVGLAVAWNLGPWQPAIRTLPGAAHARSIGMLLGLDQRWSMFAPYPQRRDGWFVAAAATPNGGAIDLLRGGARLSWRKPERVAALYPTQRWRKYMMNLLSPEQREERGPFARHVCREWNAGAAPEDRALAIRLVFMVEDARPGLRLSPVRPWELFAGPCPVAHAGPGGRDADRRPS